MSTLTLGIVVIIYMFILAWLGYIGYKQTKNASDYLLGGSVRILFFRCIRYSLVRRGCPSLMFAF